jgi:hypothetical protein
MAVATTGVSPRPVGIGATVTSGAASQASVAGGRKFKITSLGALRTSVCGPTGQVMVGGTSSVITTGVEQVTGPPGPFEVKVIREPPTAKPSAGASLLGGGSSPVPSQLERATAGGTLTGVRGPVHAAVTCGAQARAGGPITRMRIGNEHDALAPLGAVAVQVAKPGPPAVGGSTVAPEAGSHTTLGTVPSQAAVETA